MAFFIIAALALTYYFYNDSAPEQKPAEEITKEYGNAMQFYFCPETNCSRVVADLLKTAKSSIHCGTYDLNVPAIMDVLNEKSKILDVKLVTDHDNLDDVDGKLSFEYKSNPGYQLMHNKFCIIDNDTIWTGSFNPTARDSDYNNNNLVIIKSNQLASNYETEFQELWSGQFGKGERNAKTDFYINNIMIENYFCPEDWCANRVIEELATAKSTINFMTFSFTHDQIGDQLVKKHGEGVEVKGIFETSQKNAFTEYDKLLQNGMDVKWDGNKYNMHNKVFIIDGQVVVTGSFNPTKNADENNDENILIIHDAAIASRYTQEFEKVFAQGKPNP